MSEGPSSYGGGETTVSSVNAANMQMSPNSAKQLLNNNKFYATTF